MGCTNHLLTDIDLMRIDHIDQNEDHNCLDNLRLVCNSFNVKVRQQPILTSLRVKKENCKCGYAPVPAGAPAPASEPAPAVASTTTITQEGDRFYINNPALAKILEDVAAGKDLDADPPLAPTRAQAQVQEQPPPDLLESEKEESALTPTMRKNRRCEKPFNKWLTERLAEGARRDFQTWCDAGANRFECSPDTIRKYLSKRCNPENGDLVIVKPDNEAPAYITFKAKAE